MDKEKNFNPRPLAGATDISGLGEQEGGISIHAPLRGRRLPEDKQKMSVDFNPRPLAGATPYPTGTSRTQRFQSTPPCGGDFVCKGGGHRCCYFNPRPLAGATERREFMHELERFQSTPPCGGDCQTGQLEFFKRFRLFSRKSVHGSPKPHFPVLVPSVRFPFALTAPWELLGHRSFWLPGAGFCSDTCFPGCRTASCRGLCQ